LQRRFSCKSHDNDVYITAGLIKEEKMTIVLIILVVLALPYLIRK